MHDLVSYETSDGIATVSRDGKGMFGAQAASETGQPSM